MVNLASIRTRMILIQFLVGSLFGGAAELATAGEAPFNGIDRQLLEGLDEPRRGPPGEPEASGPLAGDRPVHPLELVAGKMRDVSDRFARQDVSEATQQVQQEIIDQLSELIDEAERQQEQNDASGEQGGAAGSDALAGAPPEPTGDSADELRAMQAGAGPPSGAARSPEDVWGHLPERVRQSLQQAAIDQFLPSYAPMIEQYYLRLSEED